MSRQEKTILTVFALALVLSLLALLLWQETGSDEPEILHLSVLLDGSEETAWRNFRRGADAAAVEYNVDLRYVYRYENPGQAGQLQAMEAGAGLRGGGCGSGSVGCRGFDRVSPESFCAPTGGSNGV